MCQFHQANNSSTSHEYRPREIHEPQAPNCPQHSGETSSRQQHLHPHPKPTRHQSNLSIYTDEHEPPRDETHDPPNWSCAGIQFQLHRIIRPRQLNPAESAEGPQIRGGGEGARERGLGTHLAALADGLEPGDRGGGGEDKAGGLGRVSGWGWGRSCVLRGAG